MFTEKTKQLIDGRFTDMMKLAGERQKEIEEGLEACGEQVAEAVRFLYAAMPLSDLADYDFEVYADYAGHGVFLWEQGMFRRQVPEDLFLQYVLHYRINEEDISPCRRFFYEKLADKIKGMTMKEAALAVNYWCAGEAAYQSTDERTASPMTVYRSAFGRCGEESTFTVSALRSVGIPARQVYAPRWSHCDDNHAWVEVWCDGEWYFLGACEPEEIVNKGWFTNASSRAMLIHSRAFFPVEGEEVIGQEGMVTVLNQTGRYALTTPVSVLVRREDGSPVSGALVDFEVLNYAEYFPAASCLTDEEGRAGITLGKGSIHIHAACKGLYAAALIDTREETSVTLTLKAMEADGKWEAFDIWAPLDAPVNPNQPDAEQKKLGQEKFQAETKKRLAKADGFYKAEEARPVLEKCIQKAEIEEVLKKARGNIGEILQFLQGPGEAEQKEELLLVLSDKDYRDCKCTVLQEYMEEASLYRNSMDKELFTSCVLNPRIYLEPMTASRRFIKERYTKEEQEGFRRSPASLWADIDGRIKECREQDFNALYTSVTGCFKTGHGTRTAKKIACIAVLRTLGVPARLRPADLAMEYNKDGRWLPICPQTEAGIVEIGTENSTQVWTYFQNWTIARLSEGRFNTINLAGIQVEKTPLKLALGSGTYRIITANRLPNGNIFGNRLVFELERGKTRKISLTLREAKLSDMLESIELPDFAFADSRGKSMSFYMLPRSKKSLLIWLEEGKEPTEHILNELHERHEEFNRLNMVIRLFIRSKEALSDPTIKRTLPVLENTEIYYDSFEENVNMLGRRLYADPEKLPLIVAADKGCSLYAASGYNVGTADMLLRVLQYEGQQQ